MNLNRLLSILLLSAFSLIAFGQGSDDSTTLKKRKYIKYLDFRFENGAMLSNSSELGDQLVDASYYNGIDIRLGFRKSDPNDVYGTIYRRPYIGLGWYTSTFHNAEVGEPNAVYFFITIPFKFEGTKKFTFSYSTAFGLTYNLNPFHPETNPGNVFIGSARNCYVHLGFLANYKITPRWALNGTIGFKHFSNGSYAQPNAGINLIPLTLGVSWQLSKEGVNLEKTPKPEFLKYGSVNVAFAVGSKNYVSGEDNHLKTTLGINYLRHFNHKYKAGLGLDIFYSADANQRIDSDKSDFSKYWSFAAVGSWEWVLTKRLYAPIGIAFYLHRNMENGEAKPYYERAGLGYRFKNNLSLAVTIKAHGGVADMFEWTIAYAIQRDPNKY